LSRHESGKRSLSDCVTKVALRSDFRPIARKLSSFSSWRHSEASGGRSALARGIVPNENGFGIDISTE
jgi:hypothetical protein